MGIAAEDDTVRAPALPVVKRTAIGQTFNGAVASTIVQRDRLGRDDVTRQLVPILKPNGKPRQELVVTCIVLPGTTAPVGIGEDEHVPEPGDICRLILKGKAFGDWIECKTALGRPVNIGDVVTQTTDTAQSYDAHGNPTGGALTTQAEIDAQPRGRSVGIYGPLTLRAPRQDSEWIARAEAAYHALKEPIAAEATSGGTGGGGSFDPDEEPFRRDAQIGDF